MADINTGSTSVYRIDPLKGPDHYPTWKIKMTDILTDLGLWEYVSGDLKAPTDADQLAAWKKKDRQALSTIRLRVADETIVYIASATTSKGAWDTLKHTFEPQGAVAIVMTRRKLFRAVCDDVTPIEDHIRTLRGYQQELANLNHAVSDEDFAVILITSLPESWNTFITSIDSSTLTGTDASARIISRILDQERRIKSKSGNETALFGKGKHPKKKKYNPDVTCYNCGRKGHIKPDCRSPPKEKGKTKGEEKETHHGKAHVAVEDFSFNVFEETAFVGLDHMAWLADSGASAHVVRDKALFTDWKDTKEYVNGLGRLPITGRGSVQVQFALDGVNTSATLLDAICVPDAPFNLISLARVTEKNEVSLSGEHIHFLSKTGKPFARGRKVNNLYQMEMARGDEHAHALSTKTPRTWEQWHKILGHVNMNALKQMKDKNMVEGLIVEDASATPPQCSKCVLAKQHVEPMPKKSHREIKEIGDLTVTDVWGPSRTTSLNGNRYMINYTDVATRHIMTYYTKDKEDTTIVATAEHYHAFVLTQKDKSTLR